MLDNVLKWINENRDNVTLGLAAFGSVLSVLNLFRDWRKHRKNVSVTIQNIFNFGPDPDNGRYTEVLNISIVNRSREAITISGLKIKCEDRQNRFGEYRLQLHRHSNKHSDRETSRMRWFSDVLPVKVEGLGCVRLLVASTGDARSLENGRWYVATLFSSKGRIFKIGKCEFSDAEMLAHCKEPTTVTEALL